MRKKWLLSLSMVVFLLVITACTGEDDSAADNNEDTEEQQEAGEGAEQPQLPEPDLEGIPEVVAEVNGEEINRDEFETTYQGQFQQYAMQSQMTGQEVDQDQLKGQIAESMIGTELLIQEATNRNYTVTEEDIDETINEIVELNGLKSKDELFSALEQQGTDEEEVMSQAETQVRVNQLIAEESGDTTPTEEELQEAYDTVVAQQEQAGGDDAEIPSFEEIKPDLENQLRSQKEGQAAQTLVKELREQADVTVNL